MFLVWKVLEEDEMDLSKNDSHEAGYEDLLGLSIVTDPVLSQTDGQA